MKFYFPIYVSILLTLMIPGFKLIENEIVIRNWKKTYAVVEKRENQTTRGGGNYNYFVKFIDNEYKETVELWSIDKAILNTPKVGDSIEIYYDPKDPSSATVNPSIQRHRNSRWLLALIATLVATIFINILHYFRRPKKGGNPDCLTFWAEK